MANTQVKVKAQNVKGENTIQVSRTSTSDASDMAQLLATHKSSFKALHKGEIVTGIITKLTSSEVLVDVGTKTEAVVLEKDKKNLRYILATLHVGDSVSVSVLNPESDMGYPVVSLRKFLDDRMWEQLEAIEKNRGQVEVLVTEVTKGGYIVEIQQGLTGFLPNSHVLLGALQTITGKRISVWVIELNRSMRKIIVSQRAVVGSEEFEKAIKTLHVGQSITAIVTTITPFGMFVSIPTPERIDVDGLVHISEISWDKVENIDGLYTVGQEIEVVIISFDKDAKRIDLSIKRLTQDPFEEEVKDLSLDQKVTGVVTKVAQAGVTIDIGKNVEAMIRREKLPLNTTYEEGRSVTTIISEIDKKKHKVYLVPVLTEKPMGYR